MSRPVHIFIPCYVDQYFPDVGISMVHILREVGCEPIYLSDQTCCGQPAYNSGYAAECASIAERFLELFAEAETIVAPSGSCVSQVKNHYHDLELSGAAKKRYGMLKDHTFELSQFLVDELGITTWEGRLDETITYHDACHGLRELGIQKQPRQLLSSIEGLVLNEMHRSDTCCGFGGTFAVKFAGISTAMVEKKVQWIADSGASCVAAGDSSCLMHIDGYIRREGLPLRTSHFAEILWQARQNLK